MERWQLDLNRVTARLYYLPYVPSADVRDAYEVIVSHLGRLLSLILFGFCTNADDLAAAENALAVALTASFILL